MAESLSSRAADSSPTSKDYHHGENDRDEKEVKSSNDATRLILAFWGPNRAAAFQPFVPHALSQTSSSESNA